MKRNKLLSKRGKQLLALVMIFSIMITSVSYAFPNQFGDMQKQLQYLQPAITEISSTTSQTAIKTTGDELAFLSMNPSTLDKVYDGNPVITPNVTLNSNAAGGETLYVYYRWYINDNGELGGEVGTAGYSGSAVGPSEIGSYFICLQIFNASYSFMEYKYIPFKITESGDTSDPSEIVFTDKEFLYAQIGNISNAERPNDESIIFTIMGDGFTNSKEDQDKFNKYAADLAEYLGETAPFNEYNDYIKTFRVNVISNESGADLEDGPEGTMKDTYFNSSFYTNGMERLLSGSSSKARDLANKYIEGNDYAVVLVNSEKYGGAGGYVPFISLNTNFLDMCLHEMAHTLGLADEYYAGDGYTSGADDNKYYKPNLSHIKYIDEISWERFIGKNGIGIYYHSENPNYVRPHQSCKMRYLSTVAGGETYKFCEVCQEALRDTLSNAAGVTTLSFQPYADVFYEEIANDMSEYFIIREDGNKYSGNEDGIEGLALTYFDEEENELDSVPSTVGIYTVKGVYKEVECTGTYTIIKKTAIVSISDLTKTWDGKGVNPEIIIDASKVGEEELIIELEYYDSNNKLVAKHLYGEGKGPSTTGKFKLKVNVYSEDKEWQEYSEYNFEIKEKVERVISNIASNTKVYWGEQEGYLLKPFVIMGEGFNEEDYDKFLEKSEEFIKTLFNTEPFKEMSRLFNVYTLVGFSNESGITKDLDVVKDTRYKFALIDGQIQSSIPNEKTLDDLCAAIRSDGYYKATPYYPGMVVLVNEDEIEASYTDAKSKTTNNPVYLTTTADSDYTAIIQDMANYFVGKEIGYEWIGDEERTAEIREGILKKLYWKGYPIVTSKAYNNVYYSGKSVDLANTFNVIANGKSILDPEFIMTYYEDNNGVIGNELEVAPSREGTYWAQAHYVGNSEAKDADGYTYSLSPARGIIKFTIKRTAPSTGGSTTKPVDPIKDTDGILNKKADVSNGSVKINILDSEIETLIKNLQSVDEIIVSIESDDDYDNVTIELLSKVVSLIKDENASLKIQTGIGNLVLPRDVVEQLSQLGNKVTLSMRRLENNTFEFVVKSNGEVIDNLPNMLLEFFYNQSGNTIVAVLVDEDGNEEIIRNSVSSNGGIKVLVNGNSLIKVKNNIKSFNDTQEHWAKGYIDFVTARELFGGVGNNIFKPDATMTRAMLATVLYRYADGENAGLNVFEDIDVNTWYTDGVNWAAENKLVLGSENSFIPNDNISREELAVILYRYANFIGMDTSKEGNISSFADSNEISDWANEAIKWSVGAGFISGKGNNELDPQGQATRAEVAAILQRFINELVK